MLVGSFNALFQCVSSEIVMIRYSNSLGAMLFLVHEKSNVSEQFRILQYREHIWSGFQDTEAHCKHLVPTELLAGEQLYWPSYKQALVGKKARLPFHCKPPLVLVFF